MEKKICLKQNIDVMSIVNSVSNDDMVNNLVNDLINRIEVTNFFWNGNGYCLQTSNGEFFSLLYDCDSFYIVNNIDGVSQQIIYQNSLDGVFVNITNRSKIKSHSNTFFRNVSFERKYDYLGNLIFESKCIDMHDLNGEIDENSYSINSKYFFDDLEIDINSISYYHNKDLNSVKYIINQGGEKTFIGHDEFNRRFSHMINGNVNVHNKVKKLDFERRFYD